MNWFHRRDAETQRTTDYTKTPFLCGPLRFFAFSALSLLTLFALLNVGAESFPRPVGGQGENWPGFRGPRGDGTSLEKNLPLRWSATSALSAAEGDNIAWKVPLPGKGHASPIIWGDRIFLVTAIEETEERALICLDRLTGKTIWQRTVLQAPFEEIHNLNSRASSTPLTDGERVYVSFLDRDRMFIAAYNFAGERLWEARPGPFFSKHGYCSSPILYKDKLIVNGDHDGESFLVALNRRTGETVWKIERENKTRSYCTPIIREIGGVPHMMLTGNKCVASYNPENGARRWIIDGPTEQFVAAPVYNGKLLFITAGYPELHMMAIRPNGSGNVTDTHIAWRTRRGCSYVPSPIAHGDYFLVVSDTGMASCFEADTGNRFWQERLDSRGFSASLLSNGDYVYFLSNQGAMTIVKPGPTFEKIAVNEIGEETYASPAISQGQIFIRGVKHLFAVGK